MLKNNKGITLIALVVTVIILIIIISISTKSGLDAVKSSRYYEAISELKVMQAKVNELYEENKSAEKTGKPQKEYGENFVSEEQKNKAQEIWKKVGLQENQKTYEDVGNFEDYKYFSKEYIKDKLDLEGIKYDFMVNFQTRTVMLLDGVTLDGITYYALCQVEGELYNVGYLAPDPIYFTVQPEKEKVKMLQGNTRLNLFVKNYINENITRPDIIYTISIKEKNKFKINDLGKRTIEGGSAREENLTLEIMSVPNVILDNTEKLTIITTIEYPYKQQIETPITIQIPSIAKGYISDFREVVYEDRTQDETEEEFARKYGDKGGKFEYASDGSIVLDENNVIPIFDRTLRNYENGYSVYMTIKGDINQWPTPYLETDSSGNPIYDEWGPATILGMSTENIANSNRMCWFGFRNGYFQIYSYCNETFNNVNGEKTDAKGFRSLKMDSKYSNKVLNIQITGERGGKTRVYFNGTLFTEFDSGDGDGRFNNATIGDLRPSRGIKFKGNLYDINIYNRVLTDEELAQNWEYAESTWNIIKE